MLYPGLACIVTVVSGLVLTSGSSVQEVEETNSLSISSVVAFRHQNHLKERNIYFQEYVHENGRQGRKFKNSHRLIRYLNLVILKLKNVIDKYDQKNKHVNALYKGIANCGLNNCGKSPFVLPDKMEPKAFECKKFKRRRDLKKWTLEILSKGCSGVSIYDELFQKLIHYEKIRPFRKQDKSNGSRLTILREFQNEMRALNVEIVEVLETNKRLNCSDDQRKTSSTQTPESQTDLMIKEWSTLQQSNDYLRQFRESLEVIVKCWERKTRSKRKLQGRKRATGGNNRNRDNSLRREGN